ncbi:MAG: hypothetical protein HY015_03625 [Bacteroidetes bacterium]|nr:hypothetical protein [Bacteroidota bacterium]MBI3482052.1 hypothetical protein [Bacteroidota bacterium]
MEKSKLTDDELLNYLDGMGTEAARKALKESIIKNSVIQKRLKELEAIHFFLQNQKGLEQPSKNFTDKVIQRLHAKPSFTIFSPKNGLILLIGLVVASGLALILLTAGSFDQLHTVFNFNSLPIKTEAIKIPKTIPFDVKTFVKVFVMLNLVIGFILLDRTILRPIFQRRSERMSL